MRAKKGFVYIAIHEDRHSDTTVSVFSDPEAAIAWARKQAEYSCNDARGVDHRNVEETIVDDGWLYSGVYSSEGDNIRVEEKKIDKDVYT